jgi:pimeloyl-ACP methyl ester carboxylesterase
VDPPDRPLVEPVVLDAADAPLPDLAAEPEGYLVASDVARIHFLDWGGPGEPSDVPGFVLVHGFGATAWSWTAVARRTCRARRVVAVDLRGHGLSDAPTEGYDLESLATDVEAVADGAGLLARPPGIILVGHGFGAMVASWVAARLGAACAGLVLIDGGWEDIADATGLEPWEFLRGLDEPPEVFRSMPAYLADRAGFDPGTWDADQERAARAAVVELPAGHVEPAVHPHVRDACVEAMFGYDPVATLAAVARPIVALAAADDEEGTHGRTLSATASALAHPGRPPLRVARFPTDGHNLLRYRPAEVAAAILTVGGA